MEDIQRALKKQHSWVWIVIIVIILLISLGVNDPYNVSSYFCGS